MNRNTIGLYLIAFVALIIASFALYYVLTEDDTVVVAPPTPDQGQLAQCEAALALRDQMRLEDAKPRFAESRPRQFEIDQLIEEAERDIAAYC